jgi:hypothetical protein
MILRVLAPARLALLEERARGLLGLARRARHDLVAVLELDRGLVRSPGATIRCGAPLRPRCAVPPLPRASVGFSKLIERESKRVSMRAGSPNASSMGTPGSFRDAIG